MVGQEVKNRIEELKSLGVYCTVNGRTGKHYAAYGEGCNSRKEFDSFNDLYEFFTKSEEDVKEQSQIILEEKGFNVSISVVTGSIITIDPKGIKRVFPNLGAAYRSLCLKEY